MIDTSGGFDPMSFIKKKTPGIGMQTGGPQDPIDMYRSDMPPGVGMQTGGPQTPVSMQASPPQTPISMNRSNSSTPVGPPPIPNVAPYQPIGGGGVVPGVSGSNTTLPNYVASTPQNRTNWIQPGQSGYSNVQWSGQGQMPTEMGGILQRFNDYHNSRGASDTSSGTPYTPRGDASPYQAYESAVPQTAPNTTSPISVAPAQPPQTSTAANPQLRGQIDSFLKNNPGDQGRMAQALGVSQSEIDAAMGGGGSTPGYTNPSQPPGNYTGNAGKTSDEINAYIKSVADSAKDPRLNYGYNQGQWGINKRAEDTMRRFYKQNNNGKDPSQEELTNYIRGEYTQDPTHVAHGWIADLPDEQEYRAHQARLREPYEESVRNERAAGRPGHSGEVNPPQYQQPQQQPQQIPNYVAPIAPPPITNLGGTPAPPQQRPQDRWSGTQRRRPSYF